MENYSNEMRNMRILKAFSSNEIHVKDTASDNLDDKHNRTSKLIIRWYYLKYELFNGYTYTLYPVPNDLLPYS